MLPLLACVLAFFCTLSCTIPTTPIVSLFVFINRKQWWSISIFASVGSALAAILMAYILGHYGYPILSEHLHELVTCRQWRCTTQWVSKFGFIGLTIVTALPIPHTPALISCALVGMPLPEILGAFFIGKGVKYGFTASVTSAAVKWFSEPLQQQQLMGTDGKV